MTKEWYKIHRSEILANRRKWYKLNHEKVKNYARKYYYSNRKRLLQKAKIQLQKIKAEAYNALGKMCNCCKLTDARFLTLDHINGDGYKERSYKGIRRISGRNAYFIARQKNWNSSIYQLLCWNCNCAKAGNNNVCPHQCRS